MAYRDIILADNPVNYWRLGESSGNAIDEMGVHDLVWTGTPVYSATGALVNDANTAMTLDGVTEYASKAVADYRGSDTQGSIELWFNISTAHTGALVSVSVTTSTESRLLLYARNSTGQRVAILLWPSTTGNIYQTSSSGWDDGIWHHLVCVSDGAGWSMYIDGVIQPLESVSGTNTGDWLGDITGSTNSLTIGAQQTASNINTVFNGSLDEVAVYNYPLTAAQVLLHYNAGMDLLTSVSGTITDDTGAPCQRTIAVLTRPPNVTLLGTTTSDPTTGAYELTVISGEEVSRVVFDDADGTLYNDLIDRVIPG